LGSLARKKGGNGRCFPSKAFGKDAGGRRKDLQTRNCFKGRAVGDGKAKEVRGFSLSKHQGQKASCEPYFNPEKGTETWGKGKHSYLPIRSRRAV